VTGKLAGVNVQDFVWKITICLNARLAAVSNLCTENPHNAEQITKLLPSLLQVVNRLMMKKNELSSASVESW
jgi:hypothetical protein